MAWMAEIRGRPVFSEGKGEVEGNVGGRQSWRGGEGLGGQEWDYGQRGKYNQTG